MGDYMDFGIITNIEYNKDYSIINGPEEYALLYLNYNCISVPDDIMNDLLPLINHIPTYFCSLKLKSMGIEHYGVTLIPPKSTELFYNIVCQNMSDFEEMKLQELCRLLKESIIKQVYVICFGI